MTPDKLFLDANILFSLCYGIRGLHVRETGLRELSAGATADEFIAEAGAMDADATGPEADRLDAEINMLEQESNDLNQNFCSLKKELESMDGTSEPLPFVADDILLRFDDQRASATLNVLAELSQKTQVIFFTHHRHLVDLARSETRAVSPVIHTMGVSG